MLTTKSFAMIAGVGAVGVIAAAFASFAQIQPHVGTSCSGYVTGSYTDKLPSSYIVNNCSGEITYVDSKNKPAKAK
ncbi:MAG: hypothetical protein WCD18_11895 [Thermosynechococcaceae cyanobacterium]